MTRKLIPKGKENLKVPGKTASQIALESLQNLGLSFNENGKMSDSTNPLRDKEVVITPDPRTTYDILREQGKLKAPDMSDTQQNDRTYVARNTQPQQVDAAPQPIPTDPDILTAELKIGNSHPLTADDYQVQGINVKPYEEGIQRNGEVNLPDVVVTGEMPRSYMGIPVDVYHNDLSRRMYEDRNKAGRDIALGMAAIAAPELGPVISGVGKALTPSTYINWLLPYLGTSAGTTATVGTLADLGWAGYWGYEGYKDIKDAIQHPEKLQSWTDYANLGLNGLMMLGPFSEVGNTVSAFNKYVRIPTLSWAQHHNLPYRFANWLANIEGKARGKRGGFNYLDPDNKEAQEVRQTLYKHWNPFAGYLQRSRSWEPALKLAALDEINTDIGIFNKHWKPSVEKRAGTTMSVGKAEDYLNDFEISYLPYDKEGSLWKENNKRRRRLNIGEGIVSGYNFHVPSKRFSNIYLNGNIYKIKGKPNFSLPFRRLMSTSYHEGEHSFRKSNVLKPIGTPFFGDNSGLFLDDAYITIHYPLNDALSAKSAEKAATNAEVRHFLGISPEGAANIPTERLIRLDPYDDIQTVFSDMSKNEFGSNYITDYHNNLIGKFNEEYFKEYQKNNIRSNDDYLRFVSKFANNYAAKLRRALQYEYKQGGKI